MNQNEKPEFYSKITGYKKNQITDEITNILKNMPKKNNFLNTKSVIKKKLFGSNHYKGDLFKNNFDMFLNKNESAFEKVLSSKLNKISLSKNSPLNKTDKFKWMHKNLQSKMKPFKFKNKKLFKTMTKKLKKLYVEKKEAQKSIKTIKKSIKANDNSNEKEVLFPKLSPIQRKSKLTKFSLLLSELSHTKYSDTNFKMKKESLDEFISLLNELYSLEKDKSVKISYSKLIRYLKESYDTSSESIPLKRAMSSE